MKRLLRVVTDFLERHADFFMAKIESDYQACALNYHETQQTSDFLEGKLVKIHVHMNSYLVI